MADVLSQNEVEALLAALDQPVAATSPTGSAAMMSAAPSMSHGAVSTAGAAIGSIVGQVEYDAEGLPPDITLYDFKRPERVGKEHMRALQSIHEGFSRNISATLSGFLRTIVDVKLVSTDQLTYSEFIFSLENPTCFHVLGCTPLEGHMVLEINPAIVFPIIDRLLGGGRGDVLIPRRPLTEIENRLIGRVTDIALQGLKAVWSNVLPVQFTVDRIESNPQLVYIVPPNEVIVLVSFEISLGDLRGMMNLCIPFNVIEPVIDQLAANSWFAYAQKESSKHREVVTTLEAAPIEMVVFLGETRITAEQLVNLQIGDVLPIEKPTNSGLLVNIAGKPKFRATPFTLKGRKVVRIDRRAEKNARLNG